MLTVKEFISFLKAKRSTLTFYNSTLDKAKTQCIGVYRRSSGRVQAIGEGSYNVLPVSLVVRWTEDADACEVAANDLYTLLETVLKEATPGGVVIAYVRLLDSHPVWVGRDDKNVVENVIRADIIYERGD